MTGETCETIDPRVRRTRLLLQHALEKLLENKKFDEISVQDITDAATLNRATFYSHYPDKFALLNCMVGTRFHDLLAERGIEFGACASAIRAIVLAVGDYLARMRQLEPHMESAVIAVVRHMLLEGMNRHPPGSDIPPEMIASAASWAIYGAVKERPSPEFADNVVALVSPILHLKPVGHEPEPL
jgi:AcrR family transcriptional regulator